MDNITQEFINCFKTINELINEKINEFVFEPIQIQKDVYISGAKKIGINKVEVHVEKRQTITQTRIILESSEILQSPKLEDEPYEHMYIDCELIETQIIKDYLNKLKTYINNITELEIVQLQYKLKDNNNLCTTEEIIAYDNKKTAVKQTIKKRKLASSFKSKFIPWNKNNITKQQITDEEFANMPLN